jgi:hypothetical protein
MFLFSIEKRTVLDDGRASGACHSCFERCNLQCLLLISLLLYASTLREIISEWACLQIEYYTIRFVTFESVLCRTSVSVNLFFRRSPKEFQATAADVFMWVKPIYEGKRRKSRRYTRERALTPWIEKCLEKIQMYRKRGGIQNQSTNMGMDACPLPFFSAHRCVLPRILLQTVYKSPRKGTSYRKNHITEVPPLL